MNYRRHLAVIGALNLRVDAERAFLKRPENPHGDIVMHRTV